MQSRPPLRFLWLGLVSALVLLTTTAPAQKRDFRDEKYGYAVRTVPKWVGVPVQPTEKYSVAKWASPRDERRYPGRMFVYVFDRTEKKEDPRLQELERLIRFPGTNVRSFQDWAKLYRRGLVLENPTDIKLKDLSGNPITARLYETTYGEQNKSRSGPPTGYFTVIAVITLPEREYAVELYCGSAVKKKYRSTFLKVARSFELLESPGRANTNPRRQRRELAARGGAPPGASGRRARTGLVVRGERELLHRHQHPAQEESPHPESEARSGGHARGVQTRFSTGKTHRGGLDRARVQGPPVLPALRRSTGQRRLLVRRGPGAGALSPG